MTNKHRFLLSVLILLLTCSLMQSPQARAQSMTHVVQKGDTLWDVGEFYYGDPNLWPKLWQMNQCVTNPQLLEPGDVLTLLEDVPILRPKEEEVAVVKEPEKIETGPMGINVSGLTNMDALGYLSVGFVPAFGYLLGSMTVITLGEILHAPSASTAVAAIAPEGKTGRYMGFFGLAESLGWSVGPFIGGLLFDATVPTAPTLLWVAVAGVGVLAALGYGFTARRFHPEGADV